MGRGFGEIEFLQEHIPDWLATPIALFTQLGDVWFLVSLLVVLYWVRGSDRDAIAVVSGVTLGGLAFLDSLKHILALPRPEQPLLPVEALPQGIQPLYEATAFAAGYGFPSGHALMTTIVYLSLADVLSVSTRTRRYLAAGFLVVAVSLSRIALGVHYLVDVVAGIGLGLLFLAAARAVLARVADRGTTAFAAAIVLAGANLLASPADADALYLTCASLGAFAGWQGIVLSRRLRSGDSRSVVLRSHLVRVLATIVAVVPLVAALGYAPSDSPLAQAGRMGLGVTVCVFLPAIRKAVPESR